MAMMPASSARASIASIDAPAGGRGVRRRRARCGWRAQACCIAIALMLLGALLPATASATEAADSGFQPIGVNRPFQAEVITEVMQDRAGFLWIGTREGLYLYDGQRFRRFQHEVQNPDSISGNGVRGIFEDSRGRLWINTISGGLNLLDRGAWRFRNWRHKAGDPDRLAHDGVFALEEADGGRLWVGTQAGLNLFDPDRGRFALRPLATGGEFVMALHRGRDGRLWVGTLDQGLYRENDAHDGFDPVPYVGGGEPLDVFSIVEDGRGRLWAGARDGLYQYDPARAMLVKADLDPATVRGLVNFTALQPAADGGLWVGTFGQGLFRIDPDGRRLQPVPFGPDTAGARHIDQGALLIAHDGALFAGTFGAGLFRHAPDAPHLRTWRVANEHATGLSSEDVYALLGAGRDRLLAGSFGGGVDEIALDGDRVTQLAPTAPDAADGRLDGILDLAYDGEGALWAATSEGVYRWDRGRDAFRYYRPAQAAGPSRNPGYSYALLVDRRQRLWVGSGGGGLYLYRPQRDDFLEFRPDPDDPRALSGDFVTALVEDRRGRLWVGTRSSALSVCRLRDAALECDRIGSGAGPRSLSHYNVTSLLEAADGALWVGTGGGGLNQVRLDADGGVAGIRRWTRDDGLADDIVMALVQAPDGALWLSTRGGLSRLDPATGRIANLDLGDGLPTLVFNPKAALLHGDRLYFGSAKGVVALDPAQRLSRGPPPPTVITGIGGLPDASPPHLPAWRVRSLRVPLQRPLSLEFAVLGFDGGQPEFQYRLASDQAWTRLGDRGQLTLQALAPGRHRLEVRGRIGGSAWTSIAPLQVEVVPPWWRIVWVQTLAALLLLGLLLGGFWWRMRELKLRNDELQRMQALREQALEEAHGSRDRMEQAFARLRRLTMRLEAAKEQERKHIARELHDEFGQALTAAKINLQLARSGPHGEAADRRILDALATVERLIGQVRALSLDLRPPLLDELGLLPALGAYLEAVAERSGLKISTRLPEALPWTANERDIVVFRIVQEAVTNALRHAGADRMQVEIASVAGGVRLRMHDDGRGFDPATVGSGAGSGGFGLFGMRERAYDLGGRWTLRSAPGQGTTIEAFIPGDDDPPPPADDPEETDDARRTR